MNTPRIARTFNAQIVDEASEWFVEFNTDEPDEATRRQFDLWLRKSSEHVRAYLELFSIWEESSLVDVERKLDANALIALAKDASNVHAFQGKSAAVRSATREGESQTRPPRLRIAVAASIVLACVAGAFTWFELTHRNVYVTEVGEQRVISLPDGSGIELNARSRLRVRYTESARTIDLIEGQALFRVAKNAQRPFIVRSGETAVRAVGTQFDVYRKDSGTTVTVLEGQVAVLRGSPATDGAPADATPPRILVSAGEQFTDASEPDARPHRANVSAATAWTQRRLVFESTPLTEVAEEFNRYNERRLAVRNAQLAEFLVSGVFSSTDPTSLLRFLRAQPGISVEENEREIIITAK
jgi:transmembrane sensor